MQDGSVGDVGTRGDAGDSGPNGAQGADGSAGQKGGQMTKDDINAIILGKIFFKYWKNKI